MSRLRRLAAWQVFLFCGSLAALAYAVCPGLAGSGPLMNLIGFASVVAIVVGVRMHRPARPLPWYLFAIGQGLYWAGDLYTYTYPRVFGAEVPFPSLGDGFYVLVYPVLMGGLLMLVRRRNPEGDRAGLLDSLIISVGLSLISWVLLVAPNLHVSDTTLLQTVVSIAYPLGDILLLGAAVRLAVDRGLRQGTFFLIVGSILVLLVTDSFYTWFTLAGRFDFQVILDVGWIGYLLLWGAAALHPSMVGLDQPAPERVTRLSMPRLALLAGAALIAPVTEILISGRKSIDLFVLFLASIVLFALVIARMVDLVGEQERSVERERTLSAGGAALVAAAGVEDMYAAALDAAAALSGLGVLACEVVDGSVGVVAARPHGLHPHGPVGPEASSLLCAGRGEDPLLWRALGLTGEPEPMLVLPLTVRDDVRAVIVLAGRPIRAVQRSLQALASHVSLALEGAVLNQEVLERTSQARLSSLVQHSSDLITVLDADASITYQSPSIERVLGYTPAEVAGVRFDQLLAEGESRVLGVLADGPVDGSQEARPLDARLRHKDGTIKPFEILITDLRRDEHIGGIVLNARDVSERRAMEEALSHQAFHDSVTGLANRALFTERVNHALTLARREPRTVAVMFLDLDDFKTINDSLGHAAGDAVLCEVARRLDGAVRVSDTAARFGGDEFAVLLEALDGPERAAETAERVLRAFHAPMNVDGKELSLRGSIGIAVAEPGHDTSTEELLRNADAAMYIAKRDGKGAYRMFEPAMHEGVLARLELRADLQRALTEEQFELHYQPVVRLADGQVSGFEALLRWRHPERGLVAPTEFVPFAEETGLIVDIGRWVLQEGCRQAKRLELQHTGQTLSMAVNLSVKQLQHPDIVRHVREALADAELDPVRLTLEITESVMMDDVELAAERLTELKALGLRLALDDFGTGYSSLSYLGRFPLDVLKMDRSFLREDAPPETAGLAHAVVAIGETLQLDIVAEGVEQQAQYAVLRALGCSLGQGFLFAKPLTGEQVDAYLLEQLPVATGG